MKVYNILSKLTITLAAVTLSSGIWAQSTANSMWAPVDDVMQTGGMVVSDFDVFGVHHATSGPEYLIQDKCDGVVYEMDGIANGRVVSDEGNMMFTDDEVMGDKITDMKTNRSGVITGIKEQGTMDVMTASGKTVRYQYVTFKVKPAK
jgi:hypothetical protein